MKVCPSCKKDQDSDHTYWWPYNPELGRWTEQCQECWETECSREWWKAVDQINTAMLSRELSDSQTKENVK